MPFFSSPFNTTISSVESAIRASPLLNVAMAASSSSAISTRWLPNPRLSASARRSSSTTSASVSAFSTNTLQRDNNAPFTSNDGFSVVAPMSVMAPFSTKGRKASCWALLKRWISSMNTMVRCPVRLVASARFMASRISLMPLVTAEKSMKAAFVCRAMTRDKGISVTFRYGGTDEKSRDLYGWSLFR